MLRTVGWGVSEVNFEGRVRELTADYCRVGVGLSELNFEGGWVPTPQMGGARTILPPRLPPCKEPAKKVQ